MTKNILAGETFVNMKRPECSAERRAKRRADVIMINIIYPTYACVCTPLPLSPFQHGALALPGARRLTSTRLDFTFKSVAS
jgi:hypothetical protein